MELTFLGASGTVTGSRFLLSFGNQKVMIDCGLFQGIKELRLRNWEPLPVNANEIDAVILTHAHIDHTGYLPLLYKNGFRGKVYCTQGTHDLCNILLRDSAYLQEEEANYANRHDYSKHHPAKPLYTAKDAEGVLKLFSNEPMHATITLSKECSFSFLWAGHIVGSSFVRIECHGKSLLFSGDLGRMQDDLMNPPDKIKQIDYLILESTYGNRLHDVVSPLNVLEKIINDTANRGGSILMPSFAVGRSQMMLYLLSVLKKEKRIPDLPVYLDSPMGVHATEIFLRYHTEHHLSAEEVKNLTHEVTFVGTPEESKALNKITTPKIVISASGMLEGGRVLHHAKSLLPDPKNTIVFTGYQAVGTRGDRILAGEKQIKMLGEEVSVRAEVKELQSVSAHADSADILTWLSYFTSAPKKIFLTHGEDESRKALQEAIFKRFGWKQVVLPAYLHTETL